jgi:hypothetical protein
VREHDWREPACGADGHRGNIWKCRRCGACIVWNGWPGSPIDDPHYETPPPPTPVSTRPGYFNTFSSYLDGHPRDCDLSLIRQVMGR